MALYESGVVAGCGYRFLTFPGSCSADYAELARIDAVTLLTTWAGILLAGFAIQMLQKKPQDTSMLEANIRTLESELMRLHQSLERGDIVFDEYCTKQTKTLVSLIENMSTFKAIQACTGNLEMPEPIRRVHIFPGQLDED